ncbi:hypothetical protein DWF00_22075 [Bosea caraganae]|uniref:Uncharacterized protein n=1 Tax=Bosea caraganae TaxID=2763117 RepID=A0A370L5L9_9HYPH|nr:hypothetical protein DWF00_22075 [Bosea caraganae]RDJ24565.1 hypothetical protein DWE98_12820 [Bosea caraganae]
MIGIVLGLFALVCFVTTFDYSRGRTPETKSQLVADVLTATRSGECGGDDTEIASRYLPLGMAQAEAEQVINTIEIVPPKPWFWQPQIENATTWTGETLEALRTIKTTAFGRQALRLHLTFGEGKLRRLAAEVVCRFD